MGAGLAWRGWAPCHTPPAVSRPVARSPAPREASGTGDLAVRLWHEAVAPDAPGSLVPVYLAARGLTLPADAPLRFHPDCPRGAERWPAMLALMTDPATGTPCGLHRTFLARDGAGKAPGEPKKAMLGSAGVIRLAPDGDVTLGLAEGIETALAVMQRTGWAPVWAATSAGAIRSFPVLPGIECLTVFADADGAGIEAARACCRDWAAAGCEARILAPTGGDWDDALPRGERAA